MIASEKGTYYTLNLMAGLLLSPECWRGWAESWPIIHSIRVSVSLAEVGGILVSIDKGG
jgi:hypothetical protein